jgi:hypothetical protein
LHCPYAIRARLAIKVSGVRVALREVVLRDKPAALLLASPKATVPVLQLPDGQVLEQSLDIMRWALEQHDPQGWLCRREQEEGFGVRSCLLRQEARPDPNSCLGKKQDLTPTHTQDLQPARPHRTHRPDLPWVCSWRAS